MQEEWLVTALTDAGFDPTGVELEQVKLLGEQNTMVVSFRCVEEPSDADEDKVWNALTERFRGMRVRIEWIPEKPRVSTYAERSETQRTSAALFSFTEGKRRQICGKRVTAQYRKRIHDLVEAKNVFAIEGRVVSFEERSPWKNKKKPSEMIFPLQINLTDGTDSIDCSALFDSEEERAAAEDAVKSAQKKDEHLVAQGRCSVSHITGELQFYINDLMSVPVAPRDDPSEQKRVELHLHTRMSTLDGITDVNAAFALAAHFGHKALAVTDHGVVQAFPAAAKAAKAAGVKPIFGVEGYLKRDAELISMDQPFVVFDLETTGLKPEQCEIIEIGAVKIMEGKIVDRFQTFVNDGGIIPANITELTGITNDMTAAAPGSRECLTKLSAFIGDCCLVAHNASFDVSFLRFHGARFGLSFDMAYVDTLLLSRALMHDLINHKLDTVCEALDVVLTEHHRAVDDAAATAEVFLKLIARMQEMGLTQLPAHTKDMPLMRGKKREKLNHIIILARTQAGMKNLYRLVSYAHIDHFHYHPTIPFSLLSMYREGLILGSACEQGELYQAILSEQSAEGIEKIARCYDFLEIQPRGNNAFMTRNGTASEERILEINREIVSLGDRLHLPVAATGDVHFLNPEDAIYREIIQSKNGFDDAGMQAPLYFKTTAEMLEEFAYLGADTAMRVVVDTPNAIADLCETLKPFPDGTHAPTIENANEILRGLAETKAHEIYGDPLPEIVQARLDRELKSIIGNGFASLYLMAQRLVQKSLSDGYLVGSRGSVGSSFVATMAGITEVNPLQPHYVCPRCKHAEFDVDRAHYACGIDMPDAFCPVCGEKYRKLGYEIPFEVFLGFDGDKTPDIDLNFSGEYQPVAHKYVEEMFGRGHAFRAGTISGIAERTALDYVRQYEEATGKTFRRAERERIALGCQDVKVTTGQHPGGIVIVPKEEDILDFTPIQYPADKTAKNTVTTHFDFHAMDDRLVKLDILGHDDPTALRMLQDITGLNPLDIPLDDPETRRIYSSAEPLKVDLSALHCDVGTLGTPEFGTGFVRNVLEITRPTTIEELVRIAGLTHGTDVWLGNAEPLVTQKIATLSEVICTRDDIMTYLIMHGVDASSSFKIMESVRKGRGLKPEMEQKLIDNSIPEWFIGSCKLIKYMFPRGHSVAYTIMSFRIAYYKVHHPLAFYAVYYTVRADLFDVSLASGGGTQVLKTIRESERAASELKSESEKKHAKEIITILEVVYEMNLRGIELLPVDLYRSHATHFLIEDGAIRPPFNAIPGVGTTAAIQLAESCKGKTFHSIETFRKETKANSGVVSAMIRCGCFGDMPESDQISLF